MAQKPTCCTTIPVSSELLTWHLTQTIAPHPSSCRSTPNSKNTEKVVTSLVAEARLSAYGGPLSSSLRLFESESGVRVAGVYQLSINFPWVSPFTWLGIVWVSHRRKGQSLYISAISISIVSQAIPWTGTLAQFKVNLAEASFAWDFDYFSCFKNVASQKKKIVIIYYIWRLMRDGEKKLKWKILSFLYIIFLYIRTNHKRWQQHGLEK